MTMTKKVGKEAEDGAYYNRVHSETQWRDARNEEKREYGDSGFVMMKRTDKEKRKGFSSFSQSTSSTPPYSPMSTAI